MGIQEAIRTLKMEMLGDSEQMKYAKQTAIEALEKQIPKRPVRSNPICYSKTNDKQEYYEYDYYCPICNQKLEIKEHHCHCGQNIDWS